jgi:predicted PurR-regulated permease PerM
MVVREETDGRRRLAWTGACVLAGMVLAYLLWQVVAYLAAVLIPAAVAVLLAALLWPLVAWLVRHRCPRWLASVAVPLGSLALLGGMLTFTVNALLGGVDELGTALHDGVDAVRGWLVDGPLGLSQGQVDAAAGNLVGSATEQTQRILTSATATAAAVGQFAAGLVLTLFALFFFLYDGPRIWQLVLAAVPERARDRVDVAGRGAFHALAGYTRATVAVAVVDAVFIGIGLTIIGVPMVVPLTSLVFLGAFVPYAGAFVGGIVAVLVGLVSGGPVTALLVLALNVGVQELEGDVLQPFLLGKVVRLHPLVVVFSIAIGVVLAGVIGALFAVPVVLTVRAAYGGVRHHPAAPVPARPGPDATRPAAA